MNIYQQAVADALSELAYRHAMDEDTTAAMAELRRAKQALARHTAVPAHRQMEPQVKRGKRARARKSRATYGAESQAHSGVALTLGAIALLGAAAELKKRRQGARNTPSLTAAAIRSQTVHLPPAYWKGRCGKWNIAIHPSSLLSQGYRQLFHRDTVERLAAMQQATNWLEWDAYAHTKGKPPQLVESSSSLKDLVDKLEENLGVSMNKCRASKQYKQMAALEGSAAKNPEGTWAVEWFPPESDRRAIRKFSSYKVALDFIKAENLTGPYGPAQDLMIYGPDGEEVDFWEDVDILEAKRVAREKRGGPTEADLFDDHWAEVNDAHHRWDEGEISDEEAYAIIRAACGQLPPGP